jgi:hypothetical protein
VDRKAISCKSDALVSTFATGMVSLVHPSARNKMAKIDDGLKWKNFVIENPLLVQYDKHPALRFR